MGFVTHAETRDTVLVILRENYASLSERYHLRSLSLIGSFARDEADDTSDVDLLVEFDAQTSGLFDLKTALREELQKLLGRPVDLVTTKYVRPYYRQQLMKEAVSVGLTQM